MAKLKIDDIAELQAGIKKLVAALKVILKPGPVPLSTILSEALYALDTMSCGDESVSQRFNDAVCAGIMAGSAAETSIMVKNIQRHWPTPTALGSSRRDIGH